jgi:hypothetical protein
MGSKEEVVLVWDSNASVVFQKYHFSARGKRADEGVVKQHVEFGDYSRRRL